MKSTIAIQVHRTTATYLLDLIAAKEAQQLNSNSLQGVCRCVTFGRVQYRGANIRSEDIRVNNIGIHLNFGRSQRIVARKDDGEMHGSVSLYIQGQAGVGEIVILNTKLDIRVWLRLKLSEISEETLLKSVCHSGTGCGGGEGLDYPVEAISAVCSGESVLLRRECGIVVERA